MPHVGYNPLPKPSPQEKLRKALASLNEWAHFSENDLYCVAKVFMDKLGTLYLDYFQYHIEEAQLIGMEFKELILWGTPLLSRWYVVQRYLFI